MRLNYIPALKKNYDAMDQIGKAMCAAVQEARG
jgi:hypothetical protein